MSTYEVVKSVEMLNMHGGTSVGGEFFIDSESRKEDALLLAMLYAEEHHERIFCNKKHRGIGAVLNLKQDECIGYRFLTSNYSTVTYFIREKLEKDEAACRAYTG